MNNVSITGRAVAPIEMRYTPAGKEVASGTMAVQRDFKNAQGEYEADFIDFVCWGKKAVVLADYVKKGDHFGITGQIRTRLYENQEGRKVKVTEINVESFDLPVKGKVSSSQQNGSQNQNTQSQGYTRVDDDPFMNSGETLDISDSDLPF